MLRIRSALEDGQRSAEHRWQASEGKTLTMRMSIEGASGFTPLRMDTFHVPDAPPDAWVRFCDRAIRVRVEEAMTQLTAFERDNGPFAEKDIVIFFDEPDAGLVTMFFP